MRGRGKGGGRLPAQHGTREAEVSHDGSPHVAPIVLQNAFGDVAEEALVVLEKAAWAGAAAVVVGLALGALGVEVQLVNRAVALRHDDRQLWTTGSLEGRKKLLSVLSSGFLHRLKKVYCEPSRGCVPR